MATPKKRIEPPVMTTEARTNRLISKAYDEAERRLEDGTASSQIITELMKMGTAKYELETEKLRKDNELTDAKIYNLESAEETKKLLDEAIKAMKSYRGEDDGFEGYQDL